MKVVKQVLIGIFAVGILTGAGAGQAFAEVPNGHVSENAPEPSESLTTTDNRGAATEEATPTSETTEPEATAAGETTETEGEIITEETTEETEATEEDESTAPEMWPVYLSLGGIALTVILILIINIIHRKSKK